MVRIVTARDQPGGSVLDAADPGPATGNGAVRHYLSAVHQAMDLPAPHRGRARRTYLTLLERRARIVCASLGRLLASPLNDELDYASEGDHILHQIADIPPDGYRH